MVQCGPITVRWFYPTGLSLLDSSGGHPRPGTSNNVEVAPTGWEDAVSVDALSESLIWYRDVPVSDPKLLDEKSKANAVMIPIEQLPR